MSSDCTSISSIERHKAWYSVDQAKSYPARQSAVMTLWKDRWCQFYPGVVGILAVALIYLSSELLIWGISIAMEPVNLRFLSPILGMFTVFTYGTVIMLCWKPADTWYHAHLKSKVDLINKHLSVAFAIPLVVLNESHSLSGEQIGRVAGSFVLTSLFSWAYVLTLAYWSLEGWERLMQTIYPCRPCLAAASKPRNRSNASCNSDNSSTSTLVIDEKTMSRPWYRMPVWDLLAAHWPIWASLLLLLLVGVPLAGTSTDHRVLDGSLLWFIWVTSVRLHTWTRSKAVKSSHPGLMEALSILANPVITTTVMMTAYVHITAFALGQPDAVSQVHKWISSGSPLYEVWTAGMRHVTLPNNPTSWFGAGDAVLSILECGLIIWGFKLYECRNQLFNAKGVLVCIISIISAAGNSFYSVSVARVIGVSPASSLSFVAKNVTLALAKPAMEALDGNPAVNAALVVVSGMTGYVLYPWVIPRLEAMAKKRSWATNNRRRGRSVSHADNDYDEPITVALGIAIGTNGLAMGVAYLYATNHRAAPYSALAMTVFGVTTVVLSTVEPFKSVIVALANM